MKALWRDKTGLAKWIAIFATTLGVATGLCGLNFVGVVLFVPLAGSAPPAPVTIGDRIHEAISALLTIAAYLELTVMAVSLAALFVLGIVWTVQAISPLNRK